MLNDFLSGGEATALYRPSSDSAPVSEAGPISVSPPSWSKDGRLVGEQVRRVLIQRVVDDPYYQESQWTLGKLGKYDIVTQRDEAEAIDDFLFMVSWFCSRQEKGLPLYLQVGENLNEANEGAQTYCTNYLTVEALNASVQEGGYLHQRMTDYLKKKKITLRSQSLPYPFVLFFGLQGDPLPITFAEAREPVSLPISQSHSDAVVSEDKAHSFPDVKKTASEILQGVMPKSKTSEERAEFKKKEHDLRTRLPTEALDWAHAVFEIVSQDPVFRKMRSITEMPVKCKIYKKALDCVS